MEGDDIKRISRLTAILTQLQTKRIVTAASLSEKFGVTRRTIYRDIKALEKAGVPILTEEGKGYTLMEGFRIPPIMFTEQQANALILAEQLVLKSKDASFVQDYSEAMDKIKSILRYTIQDKANLLADRTQYDEALNQERNSSNLSDLQYALTNYNLVKIQYINKEGIATDREIEPFAILNSENWYLIAWCRLREEFRFFRPDRIQKMDVLTEKFEPHKMSLQEYFDKYQ
ncbi:MULTISPECIES: helix-turn-helix transcriptional regulator [Reichenbachiella]|uniref:helix-turn-helix transcriptional regulator n=1 Tax=Reichenbachiella TaxID=156993 RepID=UPI000C155FD7|nr:MULTISPECIES: YafY family protein [Reichenbachiella]MBU2915307.1 YafY family transcriptional regulator [Reichenbachiella agariperforans]PIB34091.1 DNA-binding transcriptional regulator [Reichenbachiella sp. 5M10]